MPDTADSVIDVVITSTLFGRFAARAHPGWLVAAPLAMRVALLHLSVSDVPHGLSWPWPTP